MIVGFGYMIITGYSRVDLKPNSYILESRDLDSEAADKWQVANRIRRQGEAQGSAFSIFFARSPGDC